MRQPTCLSMQGLACLALSFTSVSAYLPMIRQAAFRRVQMQWSGNQLPITSSDPVSSCRVTFPATVLFSTEQEVNVVTNELDTLQTLFSKYCDGDGLMSKSAALAIPSIADLLTAGDLLLEEFDAIFAKAAKFPDAEASTERIDVDSFVQVYRDIDDLFEEDADAGIVADPLAGTADERGPLNGSDNDDDSEESMEAELETIFEQICDNDKLLSFESITAWDEVSKLVEDGLLGTDELQLLWDKTKKAPGSADLIDVDGFLSFNIELDGLFEFDDDEIVEDEDEDSTAPATPSTRFMVSGDDIPVNALYSLLIGADGKVGMDDLAYWKELQEMISDGDMTESELDSFFTKAGQGSPRLGQAEFQAFVESIDELFEIEEESDGADDTAPSAELQTSQPSANLLKAELFDALNDLDDPDLLPCGLDSDEKEQKVILSIVNDLEKQPSNFIRQQGANVSKDILAGNWDLLYSSSSAMKFNQGLSGIGGSFPNGKFAGLKQMLQSSKYLTDVEYLERIEVNPSSASFDVKITGSWDLRTSVSLFTGEPSIVLTIVPDMVTYGPTSTRADHWKSIGPTNMLDITYLDDDLRIMRGSTAVDNIFIYRRSGI